MAEILGTIGSIIGLVDTALKAREYIKDFHNAPGEQKKLFTDMEDLKPLLVELEKRVSDSPSTSTLQQITSPLARFNTVLEGFTAKVRPADGRWKYLDEFESIKSLISVWLAVDILNVGHQHNDILATVAENVRAQQMRTSAAEHNTISEWLTSLNFFQRQSDIFRARQPGTGEWLLSDPQFKDWELGSGKILWCRGMRISIVINHLEVDFQTDSIGVACIYLNHKETEAQTISNLLASLCKQLLVAKSIPPTVLEMYRRHLSRGTRPSVEEVLEVLRCAVAEYSKIYFIIDALDEYPEEQRNILLKYLSTIILGPPTINLMITSRPNVTLMPFLPHVLLVEIQAADDDIRRYVDTHIQKSSRLSRHVRSRPELRDEIPSKIIANVKGMQLHVESLTTKNTVSAWPRLALTWVAYSKQPFNSLAIEPDATSLDVDNLLDINIILSVCGGLVIVNDEMSTVRLVHYTAQRYFDSIQATHFPDAHTIIASTCFATCFAYLSSEGFPIHQSNGFISSDNDESHSESREVTITIGPERPFLEYSQYCFQHAADAPGLSLLDKIETFVNSKRDSAWDRFKVYPWNYPYWPSAPSLLWISTASNLIAIADHLLTKETFSRETLGPPLCVAAYFGHVEMVKLLFKFGANLDEPSEEYGTALRVASINGNESMVRLLVRMGASVDAVGGPFGTALHAVSKSGEDSMVRLLIELGADVNNGTHYGTALMAAVSRRDLGESERVVRTLLEKGADPNAQAGAALKTACADGNLMLVELLVEGGADVNLAGGETALHATAYNGRIDVAEFLIEKEADAQGFGAAFQAAVAQGHEQMVKLLIERGADVNSQGGPYGTALQAASATGSEPIVLTLLEHGANINTPGERFGTALHAASEMGHEEVVRLLIKK
ncbi:ankyrin repeat-containing domain protein, partial [Mycena olivaceomarginata]